MTSWKNGSSAWPPLFSSWLKEWCFQNAIWDIWRGTVRAKCAATWSVPLLFLRNMCLIPWKFTVSKSHKSDCFSSVLKRLDKLLPSYKSFFFTWNSFENKTLNQNWIFNKILWVLKTFFSFLRRPRNSKNITHFLI